MASNRLCHPPLVETIFEIKWHLQETGQGLRQDPHYSLLVGRLYDKLKEDYPFHEQLPAATIPSELVAGIVQHRFRKAHADWPLVQIGPGILTVNDTKGYTWSDFGRRVAEAVGALFEVHPSENFVISDLVLRYINAVPFNFEAESISQFLEKSMKTRISLYPALFEGTGVSESPLTFDCAFAFACTRPKATINLRFARGKNNDVDSLIWQTIVESRVDELLKIPNQLGEWLEEAHSIAEVWFLKLIEGDLQRRFESC